MRFSFIENTIIMVSQKTRNNTIASGTPMSIPAIDPKPKLVRRPIRPLRTMSATPKRKKILMRVGDIIVLKLKKSLIFIVLKF
jgi:hypothetical protein